MGGPVSSTNIDAGDIVVKSTIQEYKDLDLCLRDTASAQYQQDIKEFLAKPIILDTDTFNGTFPNLFFDVLSTALLKEPWKAKLRGFMAIRATAVVRMQINANKFQQGRMIMAYIPAGLDGFSNRFASLTTITQLPNTQLDIATDTSAILEIPYVTPYTHFNLLTGVGESATLSISSYLPFKYGTGSSKCDYTIWVSLKDVELITPSVVTGLIAQMGQIKRTPSKVEKEALNSGKPISTALAAV